VGRGGAVACPAAVGLGVTEGIDAVGVGLGIDESLGPALGEARAVDAADALIAGLAVGISVGVEDAAGVQATRDVTAITTANACQRGRPLGAMGSDRRIGTPGGGSDRRTIGATAASSKDPTVLAVTMAGARL
jgi:hypothetical protein